MTYANDPAKLAECNKWIDAARPIIRAMFALEDIDLSEVHESDRREARGYISNAYRNLEGMLEGIRGEYIAEQWCGLYDDPCQQEEADAFNDWLGENTISVAEAIKQEVARFNSEWLGRAA